MNEKITNIELEAFLKDQLEKSQVILLEEGKEQDDIMAVAKAKGYILKDSTDLAGFKTVYTFDTKANINKARLPQDLLLKALPGIIGKPVDIDHNRIYVVGHYIDYRYIASKHMVIAYGVFYKSNFGEEWSKAKELFKSGKLATSYEIWCPKNKRKYLADGTYMLMSMEIAGGGLMFKEKPAFPDAKVLEVAKKTIEDLSEDLVMASSQKQYDPSEIITSGDNVVVDTKMATSDKVIGKPVSPNALPAGELVSLAEKNAIANTGTTPARLNNDKLGDNLAVPGPQIVASINCQNCKKDFVPSAQTFQRKNSIDFYEVARADQEHKCPTCSCICEQASGAMKYPPQIVDFSLACPNCSSRQWKILNNEPDKAQINCMSCAKKFNVEFKKPEIDPLRAKLNFLKEGRSNCPQCGNYIPYSTVSTADDKPITCPKCDLHYSVNVKKANQNMRTISRANEALTQEENNQLGDGAGSTAIDSKNILDPVKASVNDIEESKKNLQPVKTPQQQGLLDMMASTNKNLKTSPDSQVNISDKKEPGVLYLVRHGKTSLNNHEDKTKDRIRGWKNVPLDKEGRLQAKEVGQIFKGQKIDSLYSSDLSRAYDTAAEISRATGRPIESKFDLRPWNLGDYQGQPVSKILPGMIDATIKTPHIKVKGGESFNNFKARTLNQARKMIEEAKAGKKVVAVTHTRDVKLIQAWIQAGCPLDNTIDQKEFMNDSVQTGSIHKIEPTDSNIKVTEIKDLQKSSIEDTTDSSDKGGSKMLEQVPNKEIPVTEEVKSPVAEVKPVEQIAPVAEAPIIDENLEVEDAEAIEQEEALEVAKTLKAEDRNKLGNDDFAVVKTVKDKKTGGTRTIRKYPIHDKAHVQNALARLHQTPSREGLEKLGVNPDNVIKKVKAKAKTMDMEDAEIEGYCVASKSRDMQPVNKRIADNKNAPQEKDQNNYVGASAQKPEEAKKVVTGDDAVEGLTPDQVNQMQNQLFANMKKAKGLRRTHKMVMKNIKSLKKAMMDGCFASVEEVDVIANMEFKSKKSTTVDDRGTGEKPSQAVTTGNAPVQETKCIEVNNDQDAEAKRLAAALVPEKVGAMVDPIVAPATPILNAEVPSKGEETTDTLSDGKATLKTEVPKTTGEVAGSCTDVNLNANTEANDLAKKLIPETPGEALKPGSNVDPIQAPPADVVNSEVPVKGTETPVDIVSDIKVETAGPGTGGAETNLQVAQEEALKKENEALKEKVQLLEVAAVKILERKNVLGEYGKDLSDKDILDDGKFEVAKEKAESIKLKAELNQSSGSLAEIEQASTGKDEYAELRAEIDAKASGILNKKK